MQQQFETISASIEEIISWSHKGELLLQPKFQRRDVWSDKARSYLIDTIIRGKPIPKLYMRVIYNPKTKRVVREIVDGQQRLKSILLFFENGFKISKTHNQDDLVGGKYITELSDEIREDILKYRLSLDDLGEMRDEEVHDIFARLNTYSMTLNNQELRHARYFGEFRASAYYLAYEFMPFWQENRVFTDKQILRMVEAEFVSEILLAMTEGIRGGDKGAIDNAYRDYDEQFPHRSLKERRFTNIIDVIGGVLGESLPASRFRERRLLYPLVCALFHMQFGLPEMSSERISFKPTNYEKVRTAIERVEDIFAKMKEAEEEYEIELESARKKSAVKFSDPLTKREREFYDAYDEHWVHARNRKVMTEYICEQIAKHL